MARREGRCRDYHKLSVAAANRIGVGGGCGGGCSQQAMDPQSQAFTPYSSNNDNWRLQTDVAKIQQIQVEHTERLAKLERRADEDARMKSVWGNSSPFPSVLSGTPQQGMADYRRCSS